MNIGGGLAIPRQKGGGSLIPKFLRGEVARNGTQGSAHSILRTSCYAYPYLLSPKSVLAARLDPERLTYC